VDYSPALSYIESFWPQIIHANEHDRGTLIGLPKPYLVPADGGDTGMFQEMYYWDSFFMSLGVAGTSREQLVIDAAENFAHLIERFGHIPNGSRYYFLSRSQPPFFTQQIKLALEVKRRRNDTDVNAFLSRMMALAEQEYFTVWMGDRQPHHRRVHRNLSRYFDINYLHVLASCESGWDHSTRCEERWLDHLPADLNSILYQVENDLADFAEQLGDGVKAGEWRLRAAQRAATMIALMWSEADGFFYDFDWRAERITRHPSLAGFYPLWAGLATPDQAERVVSSWLPKFLRPGGLVTTLQSAPDKQWAWPNGWAPLQWIVVEGLSRYGFHHQADDARRRWCDNCATVFNQTGAFWEKYNVIELAATHVEEGVYGMVKGFGWSNAVFVDFARKLHEAG
jgi:alpha,alpha-trehalase